MKQLNIPNYNLYFKEILKYEDKNNCCILKICNGKFRIMHKNIEYISKKYYLNKEYLYKYIDYIKEEFYNLKTYENIYNYIKTSYECYWERRY